MKIDLDHIPAAPEARLDTNLIREAVANLRAVRESIGKTSQLGRIKALGQTQDQSGAHHSQPAVCALQG